MCVLCFITMKPIAYFYPPGHQGHYQDQHPERPERVEVIRDRLRATGHWELGSKIEAKEIGAELLRRVHSAEYLDALERLSAANQNFDGETYLTRKSWELALQAAGGAVGLVDAIWERRADKGFGFTRPPGHHATIDRAMGFCLVNNVAVAAEYLIENKQAKRIAILDVDVHHGNGTQDIFYNRADVFFTSMHQSPLYPGTGLINELGKNKGYGYTQNLPLPPYSGDEAYLSILDKLILPTLENFGAEMLLISFGFDAHWRDPLAMMQLSAQGYLEIFRRLVNFADAHCGGKLAVILEGGYDLEAGAACGQAVAQALLREEFVDELGESPQPNSKDWTQVLIEATETWSEIQL